MKNFIKNIAKWIRELFFGKKDHKLPKLPKLPKPSKPPINPTPINNKLVWRDGGLWTGNKPFALFGCGDPENVLFRKDRELIINALVNHRIRGMVAYTVMTHGGDSKYFGKFGRTWNPFIDYDPAQGLDWAVLNVWDRIFTRLSNAGTAVVCNLWDDEVKFGGKDKDKIYGVELRYIQGMVNKFKHLDLLIWMVAEEYQEIMTTSKADRIAGIIRSIDPIHPIGVHQLHGTTFNFSKSQYVNMFFMQYNDADRHELQKVMPMVVKQAAGQYGVCLLENTEPGLDIYGTGAVALDKDRVCAAAGAFSLRYMRGEFFSAEDLADMRNIAIEVEKKLNR